MKALVPHYKNKYPGARVEWSEDHLTVTAKDGTLLVSLRRGGGGVLLDKQAEHGARDPHDLSPIPKNSRAFKLYADDSIGQAEEYQERVSIGYALAKQSAGKVLSIAEYQQSTAYIVDDKGNVVEKAVEKSA